MTAFWPDVYGLISQYESFGLYEKSFFENLLVEAHGLVFDVFVLGFVFAWLDGHRQKRDAIARNLEALLDLNTFDDKKHVKRKINIIKRLNGFGITKIDVTDLALKDEVLTDFQFSNSKLFGLSFQHCRIVNLTAQDSQLNASNFNDSNLKNAEFLNTNFTNASFIKSELISAKFKGSDLLRVKFIDAQLRGADFRGSNLKNTVFENADLKQANIRNCKNVNVEALSKAKCLDYIKADELVIDELKKLRSDMKISQNPN
ncbi:pentapeptide repeat-containing protein [Vibrio europaeus]|uniref:pentapeptide repeat-containing protein n=1 Tax=Vibrio europaeus TaxID=300876 RepID=UPI00233F0E56|nr:pentapeptide repeat-containing protein [Vibrio europaeus]MDC5872215.1 pentapeptide repeat-containing protein [Vibrio europaeus]